MSTKVNSLNKKWKEILFAASGFGPNFLMVLLGAYFSDAINPAAMGTSDSGQVISGVCLILPAVFPILWMIGKAFDGIIDIPFASITDNLSTKWGRRRPAILVCFIPMVVSYAFLWWPIGGKGVDCNAVLNTIWFFFWSLVFFATYTMCLIAFYGSLSNVCVNEAQRLRVSSYKSFFDTISYCVVYALVPLILDGLFKSKGWRIDTFVFLLLPIMLTMIIPLFMIKEGEKYGYPENDGFVKQEKINIWESLKLTFGNKTFVRWLVVNCCAFFGLQMFLVGMNAMIIGGMGMNGAQMAILNTCAFAPVPIMLWLFNKLKAKKGIRFTYQTCLLSFAVAIMSFFLGSNYICGDNKTLQIIIGCIGGVCGSWAIGSFFMVPYMIPAQISSVEEKITKKNHSAMYFAAQAVTTSIVGAVASGLIYENIKMLFISKEGGITYGESISDAASILNVSADSVFNLGTLLIPFFVSIFCIIGFICAFKMPKDYSPSIVAKELKKFNPDLDISSITEDEIQQNDKGESVFVQIALSILSGFIFGFIWEGYELAFLKNKISKKGRLGLYLLATFIPFAQIYVLFKVFKCLEEIAKEQGKELKFNKTLIIVFSIIFPILPTNMVALGIIQKGINNLL